MNALTTFNFDGATVRTVTGDDGQPMFVGKDVCDVLGYVRPSDAMQQHCKGAAKHRPLQTLGGMQDVRVLAEADVLRLIVRSRLPEQEFLLRFQALSLLVFCPKRRPGQISRWAGGQMEPPTSGEATCLGRYHPGWYQSRVTICIAQPHLGRFGLHRRGSKFSHFAPEVIRSKIGSEPVKNCSETSKISTRFERRKLAPERPVSVFPVAKLFRLHIRSCETISRRNLGPRSRGESASFRHAKVTR